MCKTVISTAPSQDPVVSSTQSLPSTWRQRNLWSARRSGRVLQTPPRTLTPHRGGRITPFAVRRYATVTGQVPATAGMDKIQSPRAASRCALTTAFGLRTHVNACADLRIGVGSGRPSPDPDVSLRETVSDRPGNGIRGEAPRPIRLAERLPRSVPVPRDRPGAADEAGRSGSGRPGTSGSMDSRRRHRQGPRELRRTVGM